MAVWTADGWCDHGFEPATADGWPSLDWPSTADGFFGADAGAAAGRSRPKTQRYILRIDGQEFNCRDLNDAFNVIEQAKALARKVNQERVRAATASRKATRLQTPKIEGSEALKGAVIEAAKEIKEIYRKANVDIELIALLHQQSLRDQDEELMWLM